MERIAPKALRAPSCANSWSFVEGRLLYGLTLEVEDELLDGSGSNGELSGLVTNETAFTGGATNQTMLDTIAKAVGQLASSSYIASVIVLNPSNWFSTSFVLARDSQLRYLLGDPGSMTAPNVWDIPVVLSTSMTAGSFLAIDSRQAGLHRFARGGDGTYLRAPQRLLYAKPRRDSRRGAVGARDRAGGRDCRRLVVLRGLI